MKDIVTFLKIALKQYPFKKAFLFGSYARNEQTDKSDIDILVEFNKRISLFEVLRIERELRDKLHHKVDIVEMSAIKPSIKNNILNDMISLL